jgi:hypothetical protein
VRKTLEILTRARNISYEGNTANSSVANLFISICALLILHYHSGRHLAHVTSAAGRTRTLASSERFKKDIAAMEKTSEAVLALRPVTFHYKTDASETP